MGDIAIKFENISKQYRLGKIGTGTISHDLNRWWARVRGKEDPFLKVTEMNDRAARAGSGYVWALKDIDLEVKQGEVLGIIGKNGAGKSTLLKILSRVTTPTTGEIKAWGRIASLLEVGTGFHPEMTGRENIFMNGSIMGMTKAEIRRKFDEIVDFAGIEKYIDTPVKRYSSGMTVRLGFAIAAHLEPEILVVDEVLAVGDAEFQKKAIGKMQEVTSEGGRTVLFVSHNIAAVKSLCKNGIILNNGSLVYSNKIEEAVKFYLDQSTLKDLDPIILVTDKLKNYKSNNFIKRVWIEDKSSQPSVIFQSGEKLGFCFEFNLNIVFNDIIIGYGIDDIYGNRIFTVTNEILTGNPFKNVKEGKAIFVLPENNLLPGKYLLTVAIACGGANLDYLPQVLSFFIEGADVYGTGKLPNQNQGLIYIKGDIRLIHY